MTRTLYRAALALLLTANAAGLAVLVSHGGGLPPLLGAVSLAYLGLVVLGYAAGAAWHAGRSDACRWAHRRHWQPAGRPRVIAHDGPSSEQPDPATVAADARIANAYAMPGAGRHAALLPPTVPIPVVEMERVR